MATKKTKQEPYSGDEKPCWMFAPGDNTWHGGTDRTLEEALERF